MGRQNRQKVLRAHCSNIYTVTLGANVLQHESVSLSIVTWSRANPNVMIKLFRSFYKFQKRYVIFGHFCFGIMMTYVPNINKLNIYGKLKENFSLQEILTYKCRAVGLVSPALIWTHNCIQFFLYVTSVLKKTVTKRSSVI